MKYQKGRTNPFFLPYIGGIIILVITVVGGFILFHGKIPEGTPEEIRAEKIERAAKYLPERAQITQDLGNDWYKFELDGEIFLFRKPVDQRHAPSITQIR